MIAMGSGFRNGRKDSMKSMDMRSKVRADEPGTMLVARQVERRPEKPNKRSWRYIWRWRVARLRRLHRKFDTGPGLNDLQKWRANQLVIQLQRNGFV